MILYVLLSERGIFILRCNSTGEQSGLGYSPFQAFAGEMAVVLQMLSRFEYVTKQNYKRLNVYGTEKNTFS